MTDTVAVPGLLFYVIVLLLFALALSSFLLGCYCSKLEEQLKRANNSQGQMDLIVSDTRNALDQVATRYTRQVLSNVEFIDPAEYKPASTSQRRTTTK